jgi:hypothetical protein
MRDNRLDIYRGLVMIYITVFIHGLPWVSWKSALLFEMPLIFFLAGASHTLSKPKGLITYYSKRLERIIIPYLVYACIIVFLNLLVINVAATVTPNIGLQQARRYFILNWINPLFGWKESIIPYTNFHLWFIPVYIMIFVLIPLLYKIFINLKGYYKVIPIILSAIGLWLFDYFGAFTSEYVFTGIEINLRYIIFYGIWTYIGFFYSSWSEFKLLKKLLLPFALLAIITTNGLVKIGIYAFFMQTNKFPPNFIFLLYTFGIFCILVLLGSIIYKLFSGKFIYRLIEPFSKFGYTIYLYHGFSYILFSLIITPFIKDNLGMWKTTFIQLIFVFFTCYLYPIFFAKFESWSLREAILLKVKK